MVGGRFGRVISGHFGQSHFGQFLVVTTLIGSFRPDFVVGRWALGSLVTTMMVIV